MGVRFHIYQWELKLRTMTGESRSRNRVTGSNCVRNWYSSHPDRSRTSVHQWRRCRPPWEITSTFGTKYAVHIAMISTPESFVKSYIYFLFSVEKDDSKLSQFLFFVCKPNVVYIYVYDLKIYLFNKIEVSVIEWLNNCAGNLYMKPFGYVGNYCTCTFQQIRE